MNNCVDCGLPCSGLRCRKDNGAFIALRTALDFDVADRALLEENPSGDRLAERLNISRPMAYRKLADARRRQALLNANRGIPNPA